MRDRKFARGIVVVALIVFATENANAEPLSFDLTAAPVQSAYISSEYRSGFLFNREEGELYGSFVRASVKRHAFEFVVSSLRAGGTIDYVGQDQVGFPVETDTRLELKQRGAQFTYSLAAVPAWFGLALQTRDVNRKIQPSSITQGLNERLRQQEWGAVAGVELVIAGPWTIAASTAYARTVESELAVDFLGTYDAGKLNLPQSHSQSVRVELARRVAEQVRVFGFAEDVQYSPAASGPEPLTQNGSVVGEFRYPGSHQNVRSVGLGVSASF